MNTYKILNNELLLNNQELRQLVSTLHEENASLEQNVLAVEQENNKLKTAFQVISEAAGTFTTILRTVYKPNLNYSLLNGSLIYVPSRDKLSRSFTKTSHSYHDSKNISRNTSISILNEKSLENKENVNNIQNVLLSPNSYVNVRKKRFDGKNCSESNLSGNSAKGDENENRILRRSLKLNTDECLILKSPGVNLNAAPECSNREDFVGDKTQDNYNNLAELNTIIEESTIINESNQSLCQGNSSGLIRSRTMYDNNTMLLTNIAEDIEYDELSLSKAVSSTPNKTQPSNNLEPLKDLKISISRLKSDEINQNSSMEVSAYLTNVKRTSGRLNSPKEINQDRLSNKEKNSSPPKRSTSSTCSISKRSKRLAVPTNLVEPDEINQNSSMEVSACLANVKRISERLNSPKEINQDRLSNKEKNSSPPKRPTSSTCSISKRSKILAVPTNLVEPDEINQNSIIEISACLTNFKRTTKKLNSLKEINQDRLSNKEEESSEPKRPTSSTCSISKRPKRHAAPTNLLEPSITSKLRNTET